MNPVYFISLPAGDAFCAVAKEGFFSTKEAAIEVANTIEQSSVVSLTLEPGGFVRSLVWQHEHGDVKKT